MAKKPDSPIKPHHQRIAHRSGTGQFKPPPASKPAEQTGQRPGDADDFSVDQLPDAQPFGGLGGEGDEDC
jgi:hypothetical protein